MQQLGELTSKVKDRLPASRKVWVTAGVGVLIALLVAGTAYYYFDKVPERLADDYRERAQPSADEVTGAMDRVYATFDTYLEDSLIPRRELRNADDFEEYKRRVLPVIDAAQDALKAADGAIEKARDAIEANRAELADVPSAPLLGGSASVEECDAAAESAAGYLERTEAFLRSYGRFVTYDQKALELTRRTLVDQTSYNLSVDASLEVISGALTHDLEVMQEIRSDRLDLHPHPDAERLYDLELEVDTIAVDYLEDLTAAFDNLDVLGIGRAIQSFLDELKGVSGRIDAAFAQFARNSSLQRKSRNLGHEANELEDSIAELGSGGEPNEDPADRGRPPLPPPAPPGGTNGGDGEGSAS